MSWESLGDVGTAPRARPAPAAQLVLDFARPAARWRFSRLVARSRHFARIVTRIERVRAHFPELDDISIRVGLAQKRGVLGWGSLDPDQPGIWIRQRRLELFTIAHEMTHLLQARGLIPRGERACDLHALARSAAIVDAAPSYLKIPAALRTRPLAPAVAALLHLAARESLAARAAGDRRYLKRFEAVIERAVE